MLSRFIIIIHFSEFFLRRQGLSQEEVDKDPWKSKLRANAERTLKSICTDLLCDKRTAKKNKDDDDDNDEEKGVRRSSSAH